MYVSKSLHRCIFHQDVINQKLADFVNIDAIKLRLISMPMGDVYLQIAGAEYLCCFNLRFNVLVFPSIMATGHTPSFGCYESIEIAVMKNETKKKTRSNSLSMMQRSPAWSYTSVSSTQHDQKSTKS